MDQQERFYSMSNLSDDEQKSLFRFGSGPKINIPHSTIHKAFESIVDNHPEVVAAVHGGKKITYHQLDLATNRLAHHLISSGLRPRERVCLVVQRSLEMLIALMAILKAGCQYVPIDGGVASDEALRHIFEDTGARFVLCLPRYWNRVRQFVSQHVVVLELGMETGAFYPPHRPAIEVSPEDGVYAMYTSGSTGVPKGVDVKHITMTNALLSEPGKLGMTIGSKVAQVLSISFAMGAWEMLGSLINGATVFLRGSDWDATLRQIDTLICTPSILAKYPQKDFPNIKTVVVAGETCPQALADDWAQGRRLHNLLGSTETFLVSCHTHTPGEHLSIGRPLPNTTCYILDENGEHLPMSHKGTLWVGGAGISKGYINLPLTTNEKFRRDKFANDGSMMYNFGNIVCWRADGSLDSFGRIDDQVKVKGFRIELDGVTAVLENFHSISKAASLVIDEVLHGFYASSAPLDEQKLDGFVRKQLPYYSVPERWIRVSEIPLNPNGKVDRVQLRILNAELSVPSIEAAPAKLCVPSIDAVPAKLSIPSFEVVPTDTEKTKFDSACDLLDASMEPMSVVLDGFSRAGVQDDDLEQGLSSLSLATDASSRDKKEPEASTLPEVNGSPTLAWLRHRIFIAYRWLLFPVLCTNIAVACWLLQRDLKHHVYPLQSVATATAANLCAAILIRSEPVINLLFTIFCSLPTSFPLRIRRICANVYHIGGLHVGCALSAIIWFIIFTVGVSLDLSKDPDVRAASMATAILSYFITGLLLVMALMSAPALRNRYHDAWESLHRFGGWTVLILYWVLVGVSTRELNRPSGGSSNEAYLRNPSIWLLAIATLAIIFPWLYLRRVPVRAEHLSSHAIRLHFGSQTVPGKGIRLAQHPLGDWHGFATVINTDRGDHIRTSRGYSVIVSRAGDFTGRVIDTAPTHIWRRGIPTSGVLRIAKLFKSVVVVATGSGIGPCMSIFPYKQIAIRILWTAPNHGETFGSSIVDEVRRRDPNAVIHNTKELGKPDMSLLTYRLYKESGAEAVLVISNKRFTQQIVFDMEKRGIPAYGAIFDS